MLVQLVHQPDHETIPRRIPARVVGSPAVQRRHLRLAQSGPVGEEGDVHAPLVLATTTCARPIDDDLAATQVDRESATQDIRPPRLHGGGHGRPAREHPEEPDRWHARWHHRAQLLRHYGLERGLERNDPYTCVAHPNTSVSLGLCLSLRPPSAFLYSKRPRQTLTYRFVFRNINPSTRPREERHEPDHPHCRVTPSGGPPRVAHSWRRWTSSDGAGPCASSGSCETAASVPAHCGPAATTCHRACSTPA